MSNTVKARFAIVVEPNGAWNIAGQSGADDQQMEDWAAEFITYPWEECRLSFGIHAPGEPPIFRPRCSGATQPMTPITITTKGNP